MVMLFDRAQGVLLSADALWENGFGLVFPEIDGEPGFDDVGAVLDLIATLPVRWWCPAMGVCSPTCQAALQRAQQRLQGFRTDPARHARHAVKVLVKYHLMEEREQALTELIRWAEGTPLLQGLWQRFAPTGVRTPADWIRAVTDELVAAGALARRDNLVMDA
jgi:hypothetical protein